MAVNQQGGSAIMILFVAVALFGALSYAFLQGSQGSTSMMTGEATKAAGYKSQDCTNAVNMASKRLQVRGCEGTQISTDSTGAVGTGPADGSCAIYHPNGGGVKGACAPPPAPTDTCTTGPIGTVCTSDGAIYIGDISGNRIYAAATDEGSPMQWKNAISATVTTSTTDGLSNTNLIIAAGAATHPAANACATKAPAGIWYLPAKDELGLVWTNRADIDLVTNGFSTGGMMYWSSSEYGPSPATAWVQRLNDGYQSNDIKILNYQVRCARR